MNSFLEFVGAFFLVTLGYDGSRFLFEKAMKMYRERRGEKDDNNS